MVRNTAPFKCISILLISFLVLFFLAEPSALFAGLNTGTDSKPVFRYRTSVERILGGQQSEFNRLIEEGRRLYNEEMDNERALAKFQQAESLAQTREEKADVYFYLSLVYYALWGKQGEEKLYETIQRLTLIDDTIRNLIVFDYYRELDKSLCPPKYLELYEEIKREYGAIRIQSSPPGAEVFVDGSEDSLGITPLLIGHTQGNARLSVRSGRKEKKGVVSVAAGQKKETPIYSLKKRSSLFLWLGGAVLAGGTASVFLLKKNTEEVKTPAGTIQVYSTPTGAAVFLDGNSTGQSTDCTLMDVSPGSHTVELVKEGYVDESRTITVSDEQITTVNISLNAHTLTIIKPIQDTVWETGNQIEIQWETGDEALVRGLHRSITGQFSPIHKLSISAPIQITGNRGGLAPNKAAVNSPFLTDRIPSIKKSKGDFSSHSGKNPASGKIKGVNVVKGGVHFNPSHEIYNQPSSSPSNMKIQTLSNVLVELFKGAALLQTIANSTENDGAYTWDVPATLVEGTDYSVKLSCMDEPNVSAQSSEFMVTYGYEFFLKWGSSGRGEGQFNLPHGIAVSGYVYIADTGNHRIQKFTPEGTFVLEWGGYGEEDGRFNEPSDVALDQAGNVYVVELSGFRVQKFNSNGVFIASWGTRGTEPGEFMDGKYITVDRLNNVFVVDGANHRIQKFTSDGTFITQWGSFGSGNGQFNLPRGICVDKDSFVYVADTQNNRIKKFTSDGTFVFSFGKPGTLEGEFTDVTDVAVDENGYIYVSEIGDRIQKFDSEGRYILGFGGWGFEDGQFRHINSVALDEAGHVYGSDIEGHRIQKFRPITQVTSSVLRKK